MEKLAQVQNIYFQYTYKGKTYIFIIFRPKYKEWHKFYFKILTRALQTKTRYFNIAVYGKIKTIVEYCTSNVCIEIKHIFIIFRPKLYENDTNFT